MLPAAVVSSQLTDGSVEQLLVGKLGVSLTYACLSAVGCFFLFLTFSLFYERRIAFLLSFAFVITTFFWAYTKSAWDVLGAACFVCLLLYYSAKLLTGARARLNFLLAGLSLAVACSFRFSLTPFLVLSLAGILYFARIGYGWAWTAFGALLGLVPTFIYNYVRMGSPLRPATTAPQFEVVGNSLSGDMFSGLYGLIVSPNKGLLIFAPIFILLVLLPFVWGRLERNIKIIIGCFGAGAFLHVLMLSKLTGWGSFGWGPRYLVAILPILFFITASVLTALWDDYRKPLLALMCLSIALNIPPAFVNWSLAIAEHPQATNQRASWPYQHEAAWSSLLSGIQGKSSTTGAGPIENLSASFPDLWTVRLMRLTKVYFMLGFVITFGLLITIYWALKRILLRPLRRLRLQQRDSTRHLPLH